MRCLPGFEGFSVLGLSIPRSPSIPRFRQSAKRRKPAAAPCYSMKFPGPHRTPGTSSISMRFGESVSFPRPFVVLKPADHWGEQGFYLTQWNWAGMGPRLGNRADNAVGGSLGYQTFFNRTRQQLIVELGGRKNTNDHEADGDAFAAGLRYQHAIGRHFIVQVDAFGAVREERDPAYGARLEWLTKF